MSEKRFYITEGEPDENGYPSCWVVMDRETDAEVGRDGGEPEDQTLVRDWSWVVDALNATSNEGDDTRARLEASAKIFDEAGARVGQLTIAITAALGEIKRNEGSPRLGLRGIERILSGALKGGG